MEKIDLQAVLSDDAKYVGEDAAASLSGLPAEAWPALKAAVEDRNGSGSIPGIDCGIVITRETLADFDDARLRHWSERGSREAREYDGRPALLFERFQPMRGMTRRTAIVLDCGECRAVLTFGG